MTFVTELKRIGTDNTTATLQGQIMSLFVVTSLISALERQTVSLNKMIILQ